LGKVIIEIDVDEELARQLRTKLPDNLCELMINFLIDGGIERGWWYVKPDWLTITCREVREK